MARVAVAGVPAAHQELGEVYGAVVAAVGGHDALRRVRRPRGEESLMKIPKIVRTRFMICSPIVNNETCNNKLGRGAAKALQAGLGHRPGNMPSLLLAGAVEGEEKEGLQSRDAGVAHGQVAGM